MALRLSFRFSLLGLLVASVVAADVPRDSELPLRWTESESAESLTTEKVWEVWPNRLNPHRARWALERKLGLEALQAIPIRAGQAHGVAVGAIVAEATIYFRRGGPWYRPLSDFASLACDKKQDEKFATAEGARTAARAAAERWQARVRDRRSALAFRFSKISEPTAERAVQEAQKAYREWVQDLEIEWVSKILQQAKAAEWDYYADQARASKLCGQPVVSIPWQSVMEPPAPELSKRMVARLPAKRWGGLYTVRASAVFGDKTLNGRFLIDSGSVMSMVSPSWLRAQGVNPALVEIKGVPARKLLWSGGSAVARRAIPFKVEIADGQPVPLTEFLTANTSLFAPPSYLGSCCDGVLGVDFLRHYAVEFSPGPPAEVRLYERARFQPGRELSWFEASTPPNEGGIVSESCSLEKLDGVRWDTGSELAIQLHSPYASRVSEISGLESPVLSCAGEMVASDPPVARATKLDHEGLSTQVPAVTAGMALLGRGLFVFDLGHGRIWFEKESLAKPAAVNRSGLELEYRFKSRHDDERVLTVVSIRPQTPAAALASQGLKVGSVVTQLNDSPAEDLDIWEVDEILSGRGVEKSVIVRWKSGDSIKIAPIKLQ